MSDRVYEQSGHPNSPENKLAASAVGLLAALSEDNLRRLRAGSDGRKDRPTVLVWREALRDLLLTLEDTHPGLLDRVRRGRDKP